MSLGRWELHCGEALSILQGLPTGSVDAVITDPPYSSGGLHRGDRVASTGVKYVVNRKGAPERPDFSGDGRDQRGYAYWSALWLSECLRVARPGSPVVTFTDWRQLPTTVDAVQAGGWVVRGIAVWDKTEGTRPVMGRYRNQCEYMVWGSAGAMPTSRNAPTLPGVFRVSVRQNDKYHQTGKPTELMRQVVQICERGGVVLDPFAGSATTGVAALAEGFTFIGIEQSEQYFEIGRGRLVSAGFCGAEDRYKQTSLFGLVRE